MFPFLIVFSRQVSGDQFTAELKARFKASRFYLKQNTGFTQLSNCSVERSTFQIVGRGDARRQSTFLLRPAAHVFFTEIDAAGAICVDVADKISLYASKLIGYDSQYILEFRRSGRDIKEVPCEFLPITKRPILLSNRMNALPKVFIMPSSREQQLRSVSTQIVERQDLVDVSLSLYTWLRHDVSTFADVRHKHIDLTTIAAFQTAIGAVDERCLIREAKRCRVDGAAEEDVPKALWWDLAPLSPECTTSFDEMIESIIQQSNVSCRGTTIQDSFDKACLALTKTSGQRISLLIIENSGLLAQDLSVFGRWMTLQKCLNPSMSETKVILLGSEGKLDSMWLNCTRHSTLTSPSNNSNYFPQVSSAESHSSQLQEDASSTEATNSDLSSHSPRYSTEQAWRSDLVWDSEHSEFDSEQLDAQAAATSVPAGFDTPTVQPSKKRNYSTFLQQNMNQYQSLQVPTLNQHHASHHRPISLGTQAPFL